MAVIRSKQVSAFVPVFAACMICAAAPAQQPVATPDTPAVVAPAAAPAIAAASTPIAIVPIDSSSSVTGALEIASGRAMIARSGSVTSGAKTTEVILPHRGVLRVCASTTVKLASDASVPAGETPGLMMALDHGALETSFATGRNSDILLTPDFRILIGAPGAAEVKIRLGQHGDTCVDNPGANAPYVLVTSVFDGGTYRVQPGQRVMFQHGSLQEVVDQEKEPCGCPPEPRPGTNDFPLAQSAGLAPLPPATPGPAAKPSGTGAGITEPLVYHAPTPPVEVPAVAAEAPSSPSQPAPAHATASRKKQPGFFHRVGAFFRKIFGAE
ncbi:MAG TPA: hypothetical protein VG225_09935 [Terracidiphilus sp.]|jgi:hypothetical protein|nr:hypothetical protein [Terracidiphilus sp.]